MAHVLRLMSLVLSWFLIQTRGEIVTLDMSYSYEENNTYYWSLTDYYRRYPSPANGKHDAEGFWYHNFAFFMGEHGGTHIDAPFHFSQSGWGIDEIPLSRLLNLPVVKVDVSDKTVSDHNYRVTVQDFEAWENTNGRIPENSAVFVDLGWAQYYPNRTTFLGIQGEGDSMTFSFPGFHNDAAVWLAKQRKVYGVGIDGPSLDHGPSQNYPSHVTFAANKIWGAECLAKLKMLPATGARVSVLPIKLKGGSGGASRVYATWDNDASRAHETTYGTLVLLASICLSIGNLRKVSCI